MGYEFDAATQVTGLGDGLWKAEISPAWGAIGGNPNGGYLLATAVAAIVQEGGADPLTVTAHYVRPGIFGPAEIDVEVIKRGRLKTTIAARLHQEGTERVRILATLGALQGEKAFAPAPPVIPGPDECHEPARDAAGAEATMAERFDYRVASGRRWTEGVGSGTARLDGWVRFSDGRSPDFGALPIFADALPPAIYEVIDNALVPTIELTVHLRQRPSPGWLQARFQSRALIGGVLEEDGELWDEQGQLVAMSRQLALVLPLG